MRFPTRSWTLWDSQNLNLNQSCSTLIHNQLKGRRLNSQAQPAAAPPYKLLLLGSDSFSTATLDALHASSQGLLDHIAVLTRSPARSGRGLKITPERKLAARAKELGITAHVLPQSGFRKWELPPPFSTFSPSHILVASSFSLLIPSRIIEQFPPLQALNVHPSLLPQFRGAAPIQYSLMNGSVQTGVTVQELGKGKFDQGRILGQQTVDVPPLSTFTSLEPILARHGGDLLVDVLRNLPGRQAEAKPQDDSLASLAPMIVKENARIQWDEDIAQGLIQLQNGIGHQFPLWSTLPPPPSAGSSRDPPSTPPPDIKIQLHIDARIPPIWSFPGERPGTVSYDRETKQVHVSTFGGEKLVLEKVKVANGKWIPAKEWDRVRKSGGLVLGVSTHHELADSGED